MNDYLYGELKMKTALLLFVAINFSTVNAAEELVIPDAKIINESVKPVKAGCDQCEVEAKGMSPFSVSGLAPKISADVQSIKTTMACTNGRKRLKSDVSFYTTSVAEHSNKLAGNFQSGFLSTGTISDLYVGVSAFKDLMFVTKVKNGDKIVGYNVTLSFCELPNSFKDMPAIISDNRPIDSFRAPYGIILGEKSSTCNQGSVLSMTSTVVSRRSSEANSAPDAQVPTSFVEICRPAF